MDLLVVVFMSITLLLEYQIFTLILLAIIVYHSVKSDRRTLYRIVWSYLLSIALIIGVPSGIAKSIHPEIKGAEQEVIKEVKSWIS